MRMMLKVQVPTPDGNAAIKSGVLGKVIEAFMARAKPEASYFTAEGGARTAYFFFDMTESSQMPVLAEALFMALNAQLSIIPVMNAAELQTGLGAFMAQRH